MHEWFPKPFHMRTARMIQDKETDKGKKRGMSMERSKAGMARRVPPAKIQ